MSAQFITSAPDWWKYDHRIGAALESDSAALLLAYLDRCLSLNGGVDTEDGHHWVYKSHADFLSAFPHWSPRALSRHLLLLTDAGLVVTKRRQRRSNLYRIDRDKVQFLIRQNGNLDSPSTPILIRQSGESLTLQREQYIENVTETVVDNNSRFANLANQDEPQDAESVTESLAILEDFHRGLISDQPPTGRNAELPQSYARTYPPRWIYGACVVAERAHLRKPIDDLLGYLGGILSNWQVNGMPEIRDEEPEPVGLF